MKKKFSVIVTLLLAFILCFALVACKKDDDNNNNNDNPPEDNRTVATALTALESNLDKIVKAHGFTVKIETNTATKNTSAVTAKITAEKRGNQIRLSKEGEEDDDVIIDLTSGYIYLGDVDGFMYRQIMPSGYVDGLKAYMAQAETPETPDLSQLFVFDAETSTLSLKVDFKDEINSVLAFMQTAYADGLSLKDVLDEVIKVATDERFDLESGIDFIITAGVAGKDNSVEDLMKMLETASEGALNFDELLAELDPQTVEMIKAMEVGQFLEGVVAIVNNVLPAIMEGPVNSEALLQEIMGYLFPAEPYDTTELQADLEGAFTVITTMLDAFKVDALVDMIGEKNPEVKAAFTQGFAVTECKAQLDFVFDEDDNLAAVNGSYSFSHNYTVEQEIESREVSESEGNDDDDSDTPVYVVLGDNDYTASFTLTVSNIVDTSTPWTVDEFYPNMPLDTSARIVVIPQTGDVKFLMETGSTEFDEIQYVVDYCYNVDENAYHYTSYEIEEGDIVYDASAKTYTVKRSLIDAIRAKDDYVDGTSIDIQINVTVKGEQTPTTLTAFLYDFDPELITFVDISFASNGGSSLFGF